MMLLRVLFFLAVFAALVVLHQLGEKYPDVPIIGMPKKQKIIAYAIGEIDPRFHLSQNEVAVLAYEATQIWEQGTQKTLFAYDPNAKLRINLIFDERQENSIYVDQLNNKMATKSSELDEMNQRLKTYLKGLEERQEELDHAAEQLRNDQMAWRNQEFEDRDELERIKQRVDDFNQKQQQLSGDFDSYHLNVQLYNQKVADFNQHAQQARDFNQKSPPRSFHKGTYSGDRIDVYQFSSRNDLKVTLAHEFGHALGLAHHQDARALMYPSIAEQDIDQFKLQPADLALFEQQRH